MASRTDAFTDSDSTRLNTHDANWNEFNTMEIQSNAACGGAASENTAAWTGDSWEADQSSKATINLGGTSPFAGVTVRDDGNGNCYGVYCTTSAGIVFKLTATSWSSLVSVGALWADGEEIKLSVSGVGATVTLRWYVDGVEDAGNSPYEDTSGTRHLSGAPGVCSDGNGSTNSVDDWTGDPLAAATGIVPLIMHHRKSMGVS